MADSNQQMPRTPVPNPAAADGEPVVLFTLNGEPVYTGSDVTASGTGGGTVDNTARATANSAFSISVIGTNAAATAQSTANSAQATGNSAFSVAVAGTNAAAAASTLATSGSNTGYAALQIAKAGTNYLISSSGTYYVRTDGNDSNDGTANTAGGAWRTIQQGVNFLSAHIIDGAATVQLKIADGTYAENVVLRRNIGPGAISIVGNNAAPASVVVNSGSGFGFLANGVYSLSGVRMVAQLTGGGAVAVVGAGARMTISVVEYGPVNTHHNRAVQGGFISLAGAYSVTGTAATHYSSDTTGAVSLNGITVTISGTPAFSTAFAVAAGSGSVYATAITFSGAATGTRYSAALNGVIFTNGGGANYFPGNGAGASTTGGQYA